MNKKNVIMYTTKLIQGVQNVFSNIIIFFNILFYKENYRINNCTNNSKKISR